eukprot:UN08568
MKAQLININALNNNDNNNNNNNGISLNCDIDYNEIIILDTLAFIKHMANHIERYPNVDCYIPNQQDKYSPITSPMLVLQNLQHHHTNDIGQQLAYDILSSKAYTPIIEQCTCIRYYT